MRVVCVGDCAVDRYVNLGLDRPGGITLNFAVNLRRLMDASHSVEVLSVVGEDAEAAIPVAAAREHGLVAHLEARPGKTPVQWIDQEPTGEKIFFKYEEGVLGGFRLGPRELGVLEGAEVWVGNVYGQVQGLFDSFMQAGPPRMRVVDFTNLADYDSPGPFVERYASRVDVAFFGLNPSQAGLIAELGGIAAKHGKLFVVTLGDQGSLAFEGNREHRCPVVPVERVLDTTGAGDTYAAGFMSEYLRGAGVAAAMATGSREAALAVQRVGAF
ncbi:MAG: hypothetical protein IT285_13140 [Bdellovibrionales bacterium]|nr:hypothetical protein [Bdellovibrionales bacterium]